MGIEESNRVFISFSILSVIFYLNVELFGINMLNLYWIILMKLLEMILDMLDCLKDYLSYLYQIPIYGLQCFSVDSNVL